MKKRVNQEEKVNQEERQWPDSKNSSHAAYMQCPRRKRKIAWKALSALTGDFQRRW